MAIRIHIFENKDEYRDCIVNGDSWSIRLKNANSIRRSDQIRAIENVEQHHAVSDFSQS